MNKIPVTGLLTTVYPSDTYPVIDALQSIDGLRNVDSVLDMYNIPLERRRGGMVVGVSNYGDNTVDYYKLKPGLTWSIGTPSITDWDPFFTSGTGSATLPIKYNISSETIIVPQNYQYLIYGDLIIGTGGDFQNYGRTTIMNGSIVLQGDGTYSNAGELNLVNRVPIKFTYTFSASPGQTISVSHGLNTSDISYTVRDGYNFIGLNVELDGVDPSNKIVLTTFGTISNGSINIIG